MMRELTKDELRIIDLMKCIADQKAEIAALREQAAALKTEDENREVFYQAALRNIERLQAQVARVPVLRGYVDAFDIVSLRNKTGLPVGVSVIKTEQHYHPIYIDPPADSGEG